MRVLLILFVLFVSNANAQLVGGSVVQEGRQLKTETDFKLDGTVDGWAIYDLAVNREGKVTSAEIKETNIKRTTAKMQIRNYLMTLQFAPGTHYPAFHQVRIKITMVASENAPEELEIVID